jgi:hypothetical protein
VVAVSLDASNFTPIWILIVGVAGIW